MRDIIIIGYSGHAFVIVDSILKCAGTIKGYCDESEKQVNPFGIQYLGEESSELLSDSNWIIGIGDNNLRERIYNQYVKGNPPISIIHPSSVIGSMTTLGDGVFVAANSTINPLVTIGDGVIINTGTIIEHECRIGEFSHVAPGAVLAGNVSVGKKTFIGANSVIKQSVNIGSNVTIGAGSVVLKDIPDNKKVVGNPSRLL